MSFSLDERLAADTIEIGDLQLSRALLMNDARYRWLILVPRRENLSEIVDLAETERALLMEEISAASNVLLGLPGVEKINVGALGNIVRQLHIHVVGRARGDESWPGPVWGAGAPKPYEAQEAVKLSSDLRKRLIRSGS